MQPTNSLQDLTMGVVEEIKKFHLSENTTSFYRQAYGGILRFAEHQGVKHYTESLIESYLSHIDRKHRDGELWTSRRDLLRRAAVLLKEYAAGRVLEYKQYSYSSKPMPVSAEYGNRYSAFIRHLQDDEKKSLNTVGSAKNIIRQFLLFLEDSGYPTLSLTPETVVPAFFRHLLSTYRPTSLRTVSSYIRIFLRFTEGGERLLAAVPSRFVRAKSIIPILSPKENTSLQVILSTSSVPFRDKAIMLLALRTGLRAVDITALKLGDIDWITDSISITQSKTAEPLRLPLLADVGNALASYILTERPKSTSKSVFLSMLAPFRPLAGHSSCYHIVKRTFRLASIRTETGRKGIHVLRHSVASILLAENVPVPIISALLGHKDKTATKVYLSTDEKRLKTCALDLNTIPVARGLLV